MSIGPGAILSGRYRLDDTIGRGGMGEVFQATTLTDGQPVAVKVVNRDFADPSLIERLRREAEAARRVQSDFVPQLFEVDKTPDGELFLVMELLYGETLSSRLRRNGGLLAWDDVARMGDDILQGLIDAHAAGVIHRDLKPGNIFIELGDAVGRTRILDFGVCKLDVHDGEQLTTTGEAVGTIAYMAPEQIRGASAVDARADVYSFAMVIFESLSGRLAYDANGSIALIASKLERPARSIRDVGRTPVPAGLEGLLARCLARDPDDRPDSAAELLRLWRGLGPATVTPAPLPAWTPKSDRPEPPTDMGLTAAPTRVTRPPRRPARAGLYVAGGAIFASCLVLLFALRVHTSPESTASGAAPAPTDSAVVPPTSAPTSAPTASAATLREAPPQHTEAPPLEVSPVVLSASAPDASPSQRLHPRPGRHAAPPAPAASHRAATEPHIVNDPRY